MMAAVAKPSVKNRFGLTGTGYDKDWLTSLTVCMRKAKPDTRVDSAVKDKMPMAMLLPTKAVAATETTIKSTDKPSSTA